MSEEMEEQIEEEQRSGNRKKILVISLLLLVLIALVVIIFSVLKLNKEKTESRLVKAGNGTVIKHPKLPQELKKLEKPGIFIPIGKFIVNLADTDVQRYVKVNIVIEVVDPKTQQEVQQYMPAIKDAIINLLSSKYYKDIRTPEGREELKIEILKRINAILPDGGVKAVYFTDFVVQTM